MSINLVNIGYGNMIMATKVVAVLSPESAPMRRLKEDAKERKMLVDATQGRKTRADHHYRQRPCDSFRSAGGDSDAEIRWEGDSMRNREGLLFVVSAPSGAGKTSLCRAVADSLGNLRHSISYTTRKPRPGEIDGKDYYFVAPNRFRK